MQRSLFDLNSIPARKAAAVESPPQVKQQADLGAILEGTLEQVAVGIAYSFRKAQWHNPDLTLPDWNELIVAGYIAKNECGLYEPTLQGLDYLSERDDWI